MDKTDMDKTDLPNSIAVGAAKEWCKARGLGELHVASLTVVFQSAIEEANAILTKKYDNNDKDWEESYWNCRAELEGLQSRDAQPQECIADLHELDAKDVAAAHNATLPTKQEGK